MKTTTHWCALAALTLAPGLSSAQIIASAEAYASFSDYETGNSKIDGDGYGLRGRVNLIGTGLHVQAGYLDEGLDGGLDYTETRIGGGFTTGLTPLLDISLGAEYVDLEFKDSLGKNSIDGFGLSIGAETNLPILTAYGQLEYMFLEDDLNNDVDGLEFVLGARFSVLPLVAVFGEYRMLELDPDNGPKTDIDGFRIGVRASF